MKLIDFGLSDFIRPGIFSDQFINLCYEQYSMCNT